MIYRTLLFPIPELALQPAEQVQNHCSVHHRLCFGLWLPLPDRQTSAVEEVSARRSPTDISSRSNSNNNYAKCKVSFMRYDHLLSMDFINPYIFCFSADFVVLL